MRLHSLSLEAFGPFPNHEHIDFDALDHGILLVNGPTGSGKSSLLDAITFALFGDVAGARRTLRQSLRSHHAAPGTEPYVELIFSIGTTRWKIRRVPQWESPKRRGRGNTVRHANVQISQWRDGSWCLVSARIDEAAEVITDALGMGLDQFAQVVLLPQGEFAEFLRARPEDRRTLLERLFDVERFEAVERWFGEVKNERVRAVETSLGTIQGHLAVVTDTLERLDDPQLSAPEWTSATAAELPSRLRELLSVIRERQETTRAVAALDTRAASGADRALERAAQLNQAHASYRRALEAYDAWPLESVQRLEREIDAATKVAAILTLDERRVAAETTAAEHEARLTKAAVRLADCTEVETARTKERLDELKSTPIDQLFPATALDAESSRLQELGIEIKRLRVEAREAQRLHEIAEQAHAHHVTSEQQYAAATAQATACLQAVQAAEAHLTSTPDVAGQVELIESAIERLHTLRSSEQELRAAEQKRADAIQAFTQAEGRAVRLRTQRLNGIAGELAAQLTPQTPCPVCGSCHHPAPALPADDSPAPEDIDEAEESARTMNDRRLATESNLSAAKTSYEAVRTALLTDLESFRLSSSGTPRQELSAEQLIHDSQALETLHRQHLESSARHASATQAVETARSDAEGAERRRVEAETRRVHTSSRSDSATEAAERALEALVLMTEHINDLMSALAVELSPLDPPPLDAAQFQPFLTSIRELADSLEAAQKQHHQVVQAVQEMNRQQEKTQEAHQRATAADIELRDELTVRGYRDVAAAHAVALPEDELRDRRTRWQHAIEVRAAATATLDDPTIQAAALTPEPDAGRLAQRAEILGRRAERSRSEASNWQRAHDVLDSMRNNIADTVRRHLPLAAAAHEMQELSNTFSGLGENTHKMRLTSYVLAAHLETVTAMANERLHHMTDGRYQLQYTDDRAKGNQRSGLGLVVIDAWTGRSRDTATLSGGEAFMASLALALGLGDAVRADSGGMELHTLFVDEGFGSLDQDTLEQVMEVLDGLREGGRLVGIVSHVSELRARIPTHIDIHKTAEGSTVHSNVYDQLAVSTLE